MESDSRIPVIPFADKPWLDRICRECKWSQDTNVAHIYICKSPKQGKNFVTGEPREASCSFHRNMSSHTPNCCTGKGLWWEPKPDPT